MTIYRLLSLLAILLLSSGCTIRVYKDTSPPQTVVVERPSRVVYVREQPAQLQPHRRVTTDYRAYRRPRATVRAKARAQVNIDYRARKCANLNPNVCVARGW